MPQNFKIFWGKADRSAKSTTLITDLVVVTSSGKVDCLDAYSILEKAFIYKLKDVFVLATLKYLRIFDHFKGLFENKQDREKTSFFHRSRSQNIKLKRGRTCFTWTSYSMQATRYFFKTHFNPFFVQLLVSLSIRNCHMRISCRHYHQFTITIFSLFILVKCCPQAPKAWTIPVFAFRSSRPLLSLISRLT